MSGLNRTEAYYSGLKVHNKGKNILTMNPNGIYNLKTSSITNHSYSKIQNSSENDSEYKSLNGNLSINTDNGNIILQNGKGEILYNIKKELEEPILEEENDEDIFFIDLDKLNNIRENSLLIESLQNPLCLYGNNGIDNITHSNYKVISDKEIIFQALRKIKMNTMGTLSINSEKIIGSCEEDIVLLSNSGDIKLGGDGLDNIGIKVDNNGLIEFGKSYNLDNPKKVVVNLDTNNKVNLDNTINLDSNKDNKKNDGISIISNNVNPEIDLTKLNSEDNTPHIQLGLDLGCGLKDINNSFFAKIINKDNKTFIIALDNFEFSLDDIGANILWDSGNTNIINNIISKNEVEIDYKKGLVEFDFRKAYIDRSNCANLKTKTNSNLYLGTNNLDILNFSKNGRIGVNTKNIDGSFHITNNYGKTFNIREDKETIYFNHKVLQLENTNYIIFVNTEKDNKYNLEAFLYNIDNCLLKHSIIKQDSFEEIEYNVILHPTNRNMFIIAFCYFNNNAIFVTEISYYNDIFRRKKGITKRIINDDIEKSSFPLLTCLEIQNKNYHALIFRDSKPDEELYLHIYSNTNESVLQMILKPIMESIEDRKIKKLSFIENELIYLDHFIKDGKEMCFLTKIKVIYNNKKFSIEDNQIVNINLHTFVEELEIVNADFYSVDSNLEIVVLCNNGNVYLNKGLSSELLLQENDTENIKLVYYNGKTKLIYYDTEFKMIDLETKHINYCETLGNDINNISYISLYNSKKNYIKSLLVWETGDNKNYNGNSIIFKDINSISNLVKIENSNNNIEIKDNGDIFIQDLLSISKQENTTEIKNNLVISSLKQNPINNTVGKQGQINYYENDLFIYLGNKWKKIKLEDI